MQTTKTIVQIVDEWLENSDIADISKRSYRTKIALWFRYLASIRYDVHHPTRQQVLDYKRHLENEGRSTLTIDGYITAVRLFYRYCVKRGYYHIDITEGVRSATRIRGYRKMALSREDAIRLLESVDTRMLVGKRDKLMLAMMLLLGLRTCEVERINKLFISDCLHGGALGRDAAGQKLLDFPDQSHFQHDTNAQIDAVIQPLPGLEIQAQPKGIVAGRDGLGAGVVGGDGLAGLQKHFHCPDDALFIG